MSLYSRLRNLNLRRLAIRTLLGAGGLFFLALLIVAFFYPTDRRLPDSLPPIENAIQGVSTSDLSLNTAKSLLHGDLTYDLKDPEGWLSRGSSSLDIFDGHHVEKDNQDILELFDARIILSSARFKNSNQISASFGVYPSRVEQHDGLIIPPRGSLTVKIVDAVPGAVKFHAASLTHDSRMTISVQDGGEFDWSNRWVYVQAGLNWLGRHYPDLTKFLIKTRVQYLQPEKGASFATGRQWHKVTLRLSATAGNQQTTKAPSKRSVSPRHLTERHLTIRCPGDDPCLISDVTFQPEVTGGSPQQQLENYIVVLVDTLRSDAVSSDDSNPVFQKLIAQSASFSNALSPGNMTSPSTNSLLACQTPTAIKDIAFAYAINNESREKWYQRDLTSFPTRFTRRGYSTAMIGNISVISEVIGGGVHHGFSENISIETEGYETALAALEAARWIRNHRNEPFFLYVHLNAPHAPYKAPLGDILANWRGRSDLSSMGDTLRWLYRAEVSYAARSFKKIIDEIDESGIQNKTHLILLADHGDQHRDRWFSGNEAAPKARGAFFDHGATLLNDEIGVPFVWRGPGVAPDKHRGFISTVGLGPAMLQSAGISLPGTCGSAATEAGQTIARAISAEHSQSRLSSMGSTPVVSVIGSEGYKARAIIFDGRWKYIRSHAPTSKKLVGVASWIQRQLDLFIREELYDLERDPGEVKNLIQQRPHYPSLEDEPRQELKELIKRARRHYDQFYGVTSGFQLVIDNPSGESISIPALQYQADGERRVVVPIPKKFPVQSLRVFLGAKLLPLGATAWRLPISADQWRMLPRNMSGDGALLPVSKQPQAYLIRTILNDGEVHRIAVGNPMFDQILREWGYLHDD